MKIREGFARLHPSIWGSRDAEEACKETMTGHIFTAGFTRPFRTIAVSHLQGLALPISLEQASAYVAAADGEHCCYES